MFECWDTVLFEVFNYKTDRLQAKHEQQEIEQEAEQRTSMMQKQRQAESQTNTQKQFSNQQK